MKSKTLLSSSNAKLWMALGLRAHKNSVVQRLIVDLAREHKAKAVSAGEVRKMLDKALGTQKLSDLIRRQREEAQP
jgi:hypothetical protein